MNIFVARLSPDTTGEDLGNLFGAFGNVDFSKVIFDRETGNSKCFGFVEMTDDQDAKSAIDGLDGTEFQGNTIVVKEANPREDRRPSNRGGGQRDRGFRSNDRRDRNRY